MLIKTDENIPVDLASVLARLGHDTATVLEEGLKGSSDEAVWRAAQEEKRFLITQDMGFSDERALQPGSHAGILLVRLRDPGRAALLKRIRGIFATEDVEGWAGCLVVATNRKVRVRRP